VRESQKLGPQRNITEVPYICGTPNKVGNVYKRNLYQKHTPKAELLKRHKHQANKNQTAQQNSTPKAIICVTYHTRKVEKRAPPQVINPLLHKNRRITAYLQKPYSPNSSSETTPTGASRAHHHIKPSSYPGIDTTNYSYR